MGEKMEAAKKYRADNAWKWQQYFDNGGRYTQEVREQMRADNLILQQSAHEATLEWLQELKAKKDTSISNSNAL